MKRFPKDYPDGDRSQSKNHHSYPQGQNSQRYPKSRPVQTTHKPSVAENARLRTRYSTALTEASRRMETEPDGGVLDLYSILREAKAAGIDINRHYGIQDLDHGKNISTNMDQSKFYVGMIVRVPHPVPSLDPNIPADDDNAVWSKLGPLCVKRRPSVVVAIYHDRMVVLPLYTHGKKLIDNKPDYIKAMALHLVEINANVITPRDRTLICDRLPQGSSSGVSIVYPTDPYSVSYQWPLGNQCLGSLDAPSTRRLVHEFHWYMMAGYRPVGKQLQFIGEMRAEFAMREKQSEHEMNDLNSSMGRATIDNSHPGRTSKRNLEKGR